MLASLHRYRALIAQMARRDVVGRYRGSLLGVAWSLVTPLMLLCVYGFVFGVVFDARLGAGSLAAAGGASHFALSLFAGLIVHGMFAECVSRAPALMVQNANFVKKVLFPLEIFSFILVGAAVFHFAVSAGVLLVAIAAFKGGLSLTALYLPLVLFPFVLLLLGVSWALSAVGVFVRDIGQVTQLLLTVLMFLSPVFYSRQALPAALQPWLLLNPMTFIIEQVRAVLLTDTAPNWCGLLVYMAVAMLAAMGGYALFQRARRGFADVL